MNKNCVQKKKTIKIYIKVQKKKKIYHKMLGINYFLAIFYYFMLKTKYNQYST